MATSLCLRRYNIATHIDVYRIGQPFHTGSSLITPADDLFEEIQECPYFSIVEDHENLLLNRTLSDEDALIGFGQHVGGINKRGRRLDLFCGQAIPHNPTNWRSNGNYPFFIHVSHGKLTGFFFDYPSHIEADLGHSTGDQMSFRVSKPRLDLYVYTGSSYRELCKAHTQTTGRSFLPPLFAFGYHQCRYSYETEAEVRAVRDGFRENNIPLDAIYMDIDYMDHYKVFTVNRDRFPDLPKLINAMKHDGIELVPIIDPGVKVESGYDVYEQGLHDNHFCTDESGKPFTGAVWPGLTHFPDFMQAHTRSWWGEHYTRFTELGIRGFWNDMNEPEIFYCPDELDAVKERLKTVDYEAFEDRDAIDFLQSLSSWWQKESYYDRFYHTVEGTRVPHRDVHNLYGMMMMRSVREALTEAHPNERFLLLSRASTCGSHRYGGIWTGDNHSWWEHLRTNIQMVICLGMAGQLYTGADIGGHCDEPSAELLVRWTQLGLFFPLFRNHTVKESAPQEPYAFPEREQTIMREAIRLRYALLPYLYGEFMKARQEGSPLIQPLFFISEDPACLAIEDQFMVANQLMVAPVITPATRHRQVYLPDQRWLHISGTRWDQLSATVYPSGAHVIEAPLDVVPMFLRENGLLLMTAPCQSTASYSPEVLHGIAYVRDALSYVYYEDDGVSDLCDHGHSARVSITISRQDNGYEVSASYTEQGGYQLKARELALKIYDFEGNLVEQTVVLQ